jgi:hypothetical protein
MKSVRRAFAALLIACASHSALALNTDALMKDLNQQKMVDSNIKLAFWLPPEYFIASIPGGAAPAQQKKIQAMLDGWVLMLAADAEMGAMGGITSRGRAQVMASTRLKIDGGTELSPVPDSELRGDVKNLFDMFRPLFKNMLGPMGEAVEPLAFKVSKKDVQSNELATSQGRMTLRLNGESFTWRLPLGSLLPPAVDTETGDEFPGDYRFSPYSGRPLAPKK